MPFPQEFVKDAIQSSERLVQVVNTDGEFIALEGTETLRPVLTRMFQQLTIENELVLVTEPATLVPHRLLWTKAVSVTVKDGAQTRKLEQLDRREYDYRYAVAAQPKP